MIALCRAKSDIYQLQPIDDNDSSPTVTADRPRPSTTMPNWQRGMKGHIIIHPQHPENLAESLPPTMDEVVRPICVIFVGSRPPSRTWLASKGSPLAVSRERVLAALLWLKANNPLYAHVRIDYDSLNAIPADGLLPFKVETVPASDAQEALTSRYDMCAESGGATVLPSITITDVDGSAPSNELRAAALRHVKEKGGAFLGIPHDQAPANEFYTPDLFPKTFPTLFPYGIGGLEDKTRKSKLAIKPHIRHFGCLARIAYCAEYHVLYLDEQRAHSCWSERQGRADLQRCAKLVLRLLEGDLST
ncbi:hypothetical protein BC629DRAFT_1584864 [Irpex lacteus]|nr:hypothetical protein BC629DRAFT_1584864 [Irpex lacteus]